MSHSIESHYDESRGHCLHPMNVIECREIEEEKTEENKPEIERDMKERKCEGARKRVRTEKRKGRGEGREVVG